MNTEQFINLPIVLWITFFVAERIYGKKFSGSVSSMDQTKIRGSGSKKGRFFFALISYLCAALNQIDHVINRIWPCGS